MRAWCASTILFLTIACGAAAPPPNAIYVNGRIWTGDSATPEAEALAVADGRITAVGTSRDIERLAGAGTTRVDLGGRRVVPGFND